MRSKFWPSGSSSNSSQRPKKNWEQYTRRDSNPVPLIVSSRSAQSFHRSSPSLGDDKTMDWGFDPWASSSPTSVADVTTEHQQQYNHRLFQEDGSSRMGLPSYYETFSSSFSPSDVRKGRSNPVPTTSNSTSSSSSRKIARDRLRRSKSPTTSSTANNVRRNCNPHNGPRNLDSQMETKMPDSTDVFSGSGQRTHSMSPPRPCTSAKTTHKWKEDYKIPTAQATNARPIIPGVSQLTLRQILSIVFAAFWDRADLYTDVLGLYNDTPTPRQLTLAFLRQGRLVLATPIESPDDMTLLSAGAGVLGSGGMGGGNRNGGSDGMSTVSVVRAGTPVSRKAKLKFQAVSLAYELLRDDDMRKAYDEWRKWNLRLPPPAEEDRDLQEDEDEVDSFAPRHCPDASRLPEHGWRYNRHDVNVTSILRNSNKPASRRKNNENMNHGERDRTKVPKEKQKMIRWNEEVEELTITEQLPPYDPLVDSELNKAHSKNVDFLHSADPYGDSAEEWFGSVDHTLPRYGRYHKSSRRKGGNDFNDWRQRSNTQTVLFPLEANLEFDDERPSTRLSRSRRVARDFQSINTRTFLAEEPSCGVVFEGYNPDDSLMLILDGPESSNKSQKKDTIKMEVPESHPWNQERSVTGKQTSSSDGNNPSALTTSKSIQSQSLQDPTNQNEIPQLSSNGNPKRESEKSVASHSHPSYTPSLHSIDFTSSLGSVSYSTEYGNDCDVGRTFDLAKGFQASLSNYINAAVEDMKEGLKVMGKHWDDLELMGSGGEQKNFFFLDAGELDAMMSILKEEMESIPNPFATATTCNAIPTQAPAERKSGSKGLFQSLFSNLKK